MKVLLCLFICISISITLLTGCKNYSNGVTPPETEISAVEPAETENPAAAPSETENSATAPDTDQIADMSDWTPSTLDVVNDLEGVTMAAKEGTVSPTGFTLQFENKSVTDCIYGDFFLLEKKNSGEWYQVPVAIEGDYGFHSIGYSLTAGGDSEWVADWEWMYGSLDTGEYRVVKDILVLKGTGDYDTYYLAAEFTIR